MRVALYQHFLDVLHKKMYYDQKVMTNIFFKNAIIVTIAQTTLIEP